MTDAPAQMATVVRPAASPARLGLRRAGLVLFGLLMSGGLVGAGWAWMAPPIHAVVGVSKAGKRVHDYLGNESELFFVAPSLLLGLLAVLAIVVPVAAWQWTRYRGPQMVIVLVLGLAAAAAAAAGVGALIVRLRYGALDFDTVALPGGHGFAYVIEAPPVFFDRHLLQVAATVVWPAGIAGLVYSVLAAASAHDDLGATTIPAESAAGVPVIADGGGCCGR